MTRIARFAVIAVILAASIAVFGCSRTVIIKHGGSSHVSDKHNGPPPHAPAHGYRHKHSDGVTLVFQASLGVYVVSGHRDVYFHKDRYYRIYNGGFQTSKKVKGPWNKTSSKKVPKGLQKEFTSRQSKGKRKKG
ncbi:MAG: hypothetical protein IH969_01830 [Candidatus Krumholzibacteriota bacterium]|nr:hypothetical protein [Candidatus Krumholzibacteriota bacterium]